MGQSVTAAVQADERLALAARFDRPDAMGDGLMSQAEAIAAADVVIDFTVPGASA